MSGFGDEFQKMLEGNSSRPRSPQAQGAVEGIVLDIQETTATFKLSPVADHFYGPAPFTRGLDPQPGDRCLVVFVGTGVDRPWIVAVADA